MHAKAGARCRAISAPKSRALSLKNSARRDICRIRKPWRRASGFLFIESQGGVIPYRVKIRGPSFVNLAVTHELCKNVLLADVPAIVGSIDIVMGEVDR